LSWHLAIRLLAVWNNTRSFLTRRPPSLRSTLRAPVYLILHSLHPAIKDWFRRKRGKNSNPFHTRRKLLAASSFAEIHFSAHLTTTFVWPGTSSGISHRDWRQSIGPHGIQQAATHPPAFFTIRSHPRSASQLPLPQQTPARINPF
jgi:hypothetical protein